MQKKLRKIYIALVSPAIIVSAIFYVLQLYGLWEGSNTLPSRFFMTAVFVAAITFGVAIPIFYRAAFFGKVKEKRYTTEEEFFSFQKRMLFIISVTPYLALVAAYSGFEAFYYGGTVIAALYAIYYHYPSERKINFDKKVFMVKSESD